MAWYDPERTSSDVSMADAFRWLNDVNPPPDYDVKKDRNGQRRVPGSEENPYNRQSRRDLLQSGSYTREIQQKPGSERDIINRSGKNDARNPLLLAKSMRQAITRMDSEGDYDVKIDRNGQRRVPGSEENPYNRQIRRDLLQSGSYTREIQQKPDSERHIINRSGKYDARNPLPLAKSMRQAITRMDSEGDYDVKMNRNGQRRVPGSEENPYNRQSRRDLLQSGSYTREIQRKPDSERDIYNRSGKNDVRNPPLLAKSMRQAITRMDSDSSERERPNNYHTNNDVRNGVFNAAKSMRDVLSMNNAGVISNGPVLRQDIAETVHPHVFESKPGGAIDSLHYNVTQSPIGVNGGHFNAAKSMRQMLISMDDEPKTKKPHKRHLGERRSRKEHRRKSNGDVTDANSRQKLVAVRKKKKPRKSTLRRISEDITPVWVKRALEMDLKTNWINRFGQIPIRWSPDTGSNKLQITDGRSDRENRLRGPRSQQSWTGGERSTEASIMKARQKSKRPALIFIAVLVFLALAASIVTAVVLSRRQSEDPIEEAIFDTYTLRVTLEGATFTSELGNNTSSAFWILNDKFSMEVDKEVSANGLSTDYLGSVVTSLTNGSIKVESLLVFRRPASVSVQRDDRTSKIQSMFENPANSNNDTPTANFGQWTYRKDSVNVSYSEVKGNNPLPKKQPIGSQCITEGSGTGCSARNSSCQNKTCVCPVIRYHNVSINSCDLIDCGEPAEVANADSVEKNGTKYGDSLTVTCKPGFVQPSQPEVTCRNHNTWGNLPVCEPVMCGEFTALGNSHVVNASAEHPVNTTLDVVCDLGYKPEGSLLVVCLVNGSWLVNYTCIPVTCAAPEAHLNSKINSTMEKYSVNDTLIEKCTEGYEPEFQEIKCQPNGTWSTRQTCSKITCGNFVMPNNSLFRPNQTTGNTYGTVISVDCDPGFILTGSGNFNCSLNKTWEGNSMCVPIKCMPFTFPENATEKEVRNVTYGMKINITCEQGFLLKGSNGISAAITCNTNGTWPDLNCLETNCTINEIDLPKNARITNVTKESITLQCDVGFNIIGNSTILCSSNGSIIDNQTQCQIVTCGAFPVIRNGNVTGNGTNYGHMRFLSCDDGFLLDGPSKMSCLANGTWGMMGQCLPDCGNYSTPENSQVIEINRHMLNVTCEEGFTFNTSKSMTFKCLNDREWHLEVCHRVDCSNFTLVPANGQIFNQSGTQFGDNVTVQCNTGYVLNGSQLIRCQATGIWETSPECKIVDCGVPPDPEHGVAVYKNISFGANATLACNPGYLITGNASIKCEVSGTWSQGAACKILDCGNLTTLPANTTATLVNGTTTFGSLLSFNCTEGLTIVGSDSTKTCGENATWEGRDPVCSPIESVSFNASSNTFQQGSVRSITCNVTGAVNWTSISIVRPSLNHYVLNVTHDVNAMTFANSSDATVRFGDSSSLMSNAASVEVVFDGVDCQDDGNYACLVLVGTDVGTGVNYSIATTNILVATQPEAPSLTLPEMASDGFETEVTCAGRLGRTAPNNTTASVTLEAMKQSDASFAVVGRESNVTSLERECQIEKNVTFMFTPDATFNNATFRCRVEMEGDVLFSDNITMMVASCAILPDVDSGNLTYINESDKTKADLKCEAGYQPNGSTVINCNENGTWNLTSGCEPVNCGEFNLTIQNAKVNEPSGLTYTSTIKVVCDLGYVIDNYTDLITCQANGKWSTSPVCRPVKCDISNINVANGNIVNIIYLDVNETLPVNSLICDTGFKEGNGTSSRCLPTGNLSSVPSCIPVDCGSVNSSLPEHSTEKSSNGTAYNSTVYIQCDNGSFLLEANVDFIQCNKDGMWETSAVCTVVGPVEFDNSTYTAAVNSSVNITCIANQAPNWTNMMITTSNLTVLILNQTDSLNDTSDHMVTNGTVFLSENSWVTADSATASIQLENLQCSDAGEYVCLVFAVGENKQLSNSRVNSGTTNIEVEGCD